VLDNKEYRDLVICNNCLWAASLLKRSTGFKICPICRSENLEVIPVEDYESYKMNIDSKRGIEIHFTKEKS
jgi:Zn finger protein HypA/HybF involved in hydrogenase expression